MASTALVISLSLLMLSLAVLALPKRHKRNVYGGERQLNSENQRYQCVEMPLPNVCMDYFGTEDWYARFPNSRGLTRDQAIQEFYHFLDLLYQNNYCSHMLYALLCFHYFPKCSLSRPEVAAIPCREVCEEVSAACLPIAYALEGNDLDIPQHLSCINFESAETGAAGSAEATCNPASGGSSGSGSGESGCSTSGPAPQILACPNASIHIDFCPPIGHLEYVVSEGDGSLEVCLTLANIGSYNISMTLTTKVTVQLSTTATDLTFLSRATEGRDYETVFATIIFPVGSYKHDKRCVNVPIIDDGLIERQESFSMSASILSPSTANIGGAAQSSSRSIEVIIVDNDTPADIEGLCKGNCNIRDKVSGSTFRTNCYTFVAHVEAIRRRDFDGFSLLDVYIISCWSLGACAPNGTTYSITICPNCEMTITNGKEYVVAGVHDSNGALLVLNSKKEGLVGNWKRKYRSISQWVQSGIDYHAANPDECS